MRRHSRPQGLSPESTRFSTEHLDQRELLQQAKGKMKFFITCPLATPGASMNLFQGAILHKLWQPMIDDYIHYYCVYTAKLTLASQVLLNSCAQIVNI